MNPWYVVAGVLAGIGMAGIVYVRWSKKHAFTREQIDPIFVNALDILEKKIASETDEDVKNAMRKKCESSIRYLKREDVREQTRKILTDIGALAIRGGGWQELLDLIFLEMIVQTESLGDYTLNFWPCGECACVAHSPNKWTREKRI